MTAPAIDLAKLKALGAMSAEELGETEEDVKIRFVVPLLEALGHSRLRFEHKGMDVVLKDGLPRGGTVVVEAKRPDVSLDAHLAQLERYSFEERSLLSVLTNGRVLRVYAPFWNKAKSFAETLLWVFHRGDLAHSRHVEALASVLSHEALASRKARSALQQREATVEFIWEFAQDIRQRQREWREQLEQRLGEIDQQMAELDAEERLRQKQLREDGANERDRIRRLFKLARVPLVPTGEFGDAVAAPAEPKTAEKRPQPKPDEWTEDELFRMATPYQRRIFAAFVQAGQRTLGLKEIAKRTRLNPTAVTGATRHFRTRKEIAGREPVIEFQKASADERDRRGNLFSIAPRYWPLIKRLYRDQARQSKKRRKKRGRK